MDPLSKLPTEGEIQDISAEAFYGTGEAGEIVDITEEEFAAPPPDSEVPMETPETTVWSRYKDDVATNGFNVLQRYGLTGAQLFGASAGIRAIGDAAVTGIAAGYDAVDDYLPDYVREGIAKGVTTAGEYLSEADKAVKAGLRYIGMDDTNQRMLGAAFDIATLGPGSTKNLLKEIPRSERTRLAKLADHLRQSGVKKGIDEKAGKLLKRVAPENPADFDRQTLYRETGPVRERTLVVGEESSLQDQAVALARIKDLNENRSYTHMTEKVYDELDRSKKKVDELVNTHNKKLDVGYVADELLESLDDLDNNAWYSFLPGDAQKAADDFIVMALETVNEGSKKGKTNLRKILDARRDLDNKFEGIKRNLDPGNPRNGAEVAWRHVRNELNDMLRRNMPEAAGDAVYDLNLHQHHLINAQKSMLPRIPQEAVNSLYRSARYLREHALLPSTALALAATAQFFAPIAPVALTGAAAVGSATAAYKFARSAAGRKALAKTIKGMDEVIRITKDPKALAELRADRVVLLDLMRAGDLDESEAED